MSDDGYNYPGRFIGFGFNFDPSNDKMVVDWVIENSPAVGVLQTGDTFVSVAGVPATRENRENGVLSFSIAPGFVKTEMADDFIKKYSFDHAMEGIVLNRLTEPSDIAPIVSFITSGKLDHATGSTIDINGGSYLR